MRDLNPQPDPARVDEEPYFWFLWGRLRACDLKQANKSPLVPYCCCGWFYNFQFIWQPLSFHRSGHSNVSEESSRNLSFVSWSRLPLITKGKGWAWYRVLSFQEVNARLKLSSPNGRTSSPAIKQRHLTFLHSFFILLTHIHSMFHNAVWATFRGAVLPNIVLLIVVYTSSDDKSKQFEFFPMLSVAH